MRGAGPGRGAWADAAAASRLRLRLRLPLRLPKFCRNASVVKNPVAGIRVFAPNGADLADCSGQAEAALGARAFLERPWAPGERRGGRPSGRQPRFLSRRSFAASCLSGPIRQNAAENQEARPIASHRHGGKIGRAAPDLETMGGMQEALTFPTPSNHGRARAPVALSREREETAILPLQPSVKRLFVGLLTLLAAGTPTMGGSTLLRGDP